MNHETQRKMTYLAGFLFTLPVAITTYINSSFLKEFVGDKYVGLIYIFASVLAILALVEMPRVLSRLGNWKAALLFSGLTLFSFVLLSSGTGAGIVIPAFVLYFVATGLTLACLDIFLEDFSERRSLGGQRGIFLLCTNSAWVISQVIAIPVISRASYEGIYFFAGAAVLLLFLLIFFSSLRNFNDPPYEKTNFRKTFSEFTRDRNLLRVYFANFLLKFFFAWMVIYSPIYLRESIGLSWEEIGVVFAAMLTAFVILDVPLGKISDKIGEKELLLAGFFLITAATALIPLVRTSSLLVWAVLLFVTRLGAATIEVMSESYFFKVAREEDVNKLGFFRNTFYLSYVIAPLLSTPLLFIFPSMGYIFLLLSAIMATGFLATLRLKDVE